MFRLDPRSLLSRPAIYNLHSWLAASGARKRRFVEEILQIGNGERVLDIGCGTAPLLAHMPPVTYVGFDLSPDYVRAAQARAPAHATFYHRPLTLGAVQELQPFDVVLAMGVLHHLDDAEADVLFQVAHAALKSGGRLMTCDGVYAPGQNPIARFLLSLDRGRHVRGEAAYVALARKVFPSVVASVRHDLNAYPYSHCLMTCRRIP